jgi:hypothetical protein
MHEVGRPPRRSNAAALEALKKSTVPAKPDQEKMITIFFFDFTSSQ